MSKETVVVEIRPAEGGDDAKLFTFDIFKMLSAYCKRKRWDIQVVAMRPAGRHGYQEITLVVSGKGALAGLLPEVGGHRVQRVPPTEKRGRRQTSTITVAVLPQPRDVDVKIRDSDLKWETMRGTGPGGQHRNTTDSAVRVTHKPTGVSAYSDTKSQHDNRKYALAVLKSRLSEQMKQKAKREHNVTRARQIGAGMRGDKRRTYNFRENRVTDHVSGKTVRNVKAVLGGKLDQLR